MNQFGGSWTEAKMEIVVSYAKAYLTIMEKQSWAKTMYFDGFAGSGIIETDETEEVKKGTALRILDIIDPNPFDLYYFVELDELHKTELEKRIHENYFGRNAHVVEADCNEKLKSMGKFLKENKNYLPMSILIPSAIIIAPNAFLICSGVNASANLLPKKLPIIKLAQRIRATLKSTAPCLL